MSLTKVSYSMINGSPANVLDFGAVGDGVTDCYQAFVDAIASFPHDQDTTYYSPGGVIEVPPGEYYLSQPLSIERTITLQGAGAFDFGASKLIFPADTDGLIVQRYNTGTSGKGGDGTIISGLVITQQAGGTVGPTGGAGIWMRARAYVQNCAIDGFKYVGVAIIATSGGGGLLEGNANCWRLQNVRVTNSGSDGVFVSGADVNAGLAELVDCSSNGGFGIYDASFLGNTYVGCHTASNTGGCYKTTNNNAATVFLGCYSEPGQPAASLVYPSQVIGGSQGAGLNVSSASFLQNSSAGLTVQQMPLLPYKGISFANTTKTSEANTLDAYIESFWTPTVIGLTTTGTPTYSGTYTRIGNRVFFEIQIDVSGGTTASTAGTTYISLPVTVSGNGTCTASSYSSIANYGSGFIYGVAGVVFPPSWSATSNVVVISGQYRCTST